MDFNMTLITSWLLQCHFTTWSVSESTHIPFKRQNHMALASCNVISQQSQCETRHPISNDWVSTTSFWCPPLITNLRPSRRGRARKIPLFRQLRAFKKKCIFFFWKEKKNAYCSFKKKNVYCKDLIVFIGWPLFTFWQPKEQESTDPYLLGKSLASTTQRQHRCWYQMKKKIEIERAVVEFML